MFMKDGSRPPCPAPIPTRLQTDHLWKLNYTLVVARFFYFFYICIVAKCYSVKRGKRSTYSWSIRFLLLVLLLSNLCTGGNVLPQYALAPPHCQILYISPSYKYKYKPILVEVDKIAQRCIIGKNTHPSTISFVGVDWQITKQGHMGSNCVMISVLIMHTKRHTNLPLTRLLTKCIITDEKCDAWLVQEHDRCRRAMDRSFKARVS